MPVAGLSLAGFFAEPEAISYYNMACVYPGATAADHSARWAAAKARIGTVPRVASVGIPDLCDVPPVYAQHLATVSSGARFQQTFPGPPIFKLVEIAPLLAFQWHVLSNPPSTATLGSPPTLDEVVMTCLPPGLPPCPVTRVQSGNATQGSVHLVSDDLNLSVLGLMGGPQGGFDPVTETFPTGVAVGLRTPIVQVARFDGRCYLRNGYHRAVRLMRAGASHLACLFTETYDYQEGVDPNVGMGGTFRLETMQSPNPPTIAHYADGVADEVALRRFRRQTVVTWTEVPVPLE